MKVLFISIADLPDYQSDMVFHGLRTLLKENCVDSREMWYMYSGLKERYWNERAPENGKSYGRGFTICGLLDRIEIDRSNLEEKIKNKFFDKIIYGSIHRCQDYIQTVLSCYDKKDIIFIDGEDHPDRIVVPLIDKGVYYKRELMFDSENLFPINFCVPEQLILSSIPEKTQDYGTIIPGKIETYVFDDQESYYKDYQKSYYGLTFRKGGWDCLRHYEIMMNACMPYFPGLDECPKNIMTLFPKDLVINNNRVLQTQGLPSDYNETLNKLLEHTRKYLTTTYTAQMILNK